MALDPNTSENPTEILEKRVSDLERKFNDSKLKKTASQTPLAIAAAAMLLAALIAVLLNDINITLFIVVTSLGIVQGCLDFYKGDDKPKWSLITRFVLFISGLAIFSLQF